MIKLAIGLILGTFIGGAMAVSGIKDDLQKVGYTFYLDKQTNTWAVSKMETFPQVPEGSLPSFQ